MEDEDTKLVELVLKGSLNDYHHLVEKYRYFAERWALKYVGNFIDAENIAQEAFIEAYLSLDTLREPHKFGSWLQSIVNHIAVSWLRKRRETISFEQISNLCNDELFIQHTQYSQTMPDTLLIQQEYDQQLRTAINKLPPTYRCVTEMFYFDDCSYKEIVESMDLTMSAVKSILYRSRQKLKKEMQRNE